MTKQGALKHNFQGRYEIPNVTYFTSGDYIEIKFKGIWIKGRIEYSHSDEDYYFISKDDIEVHELNGIEARVK